MRVMLSAKAVWAAVKDVDVAKKVRTASIMVRKSRVEALMYWVQLSL